MATVVVIGIVVLAIAGWAWFCYHFPVLGGIISLINLFTD